MESGRRMNVRRGAVAATASLVFGTVVVQADAGPAGPVPPGLAGTWAATVPNYPAVGLYKGRYRLRFGPGSKMQYIVPGEGAVPQDVSVNGNRITFMPSGVCITSGRYTWTVAGRSLTFTNVNDGCRKRVLQLRRKWMRVS